MLLSWDDLIGLLVADWLRRWRPGTGGLGGVAMERANTLGREERISFRGSIGGLSGIDVASIFGKVGYKQAQAIVVATSSRRHEDGERLITAAIDNISQRGRGKWMRASMANKA